MPANYPMPDSPTDTLKINVGGRDEVCRVVWSQINGKHIVVQTPDGRQLVAKWRLGDWYELAPATIAAILNKE
jgi:hypothetical protein